MDASGRMLLAQIENALDISKVNEAQAELRADPIQLDQLIAAVITNHAALKDKKAMKFGTNGCIMQHRISLGIK